MTGGIPAKRVPIFGKKTWLDGDKLIWTAAGYFSSLLRVAWGFFGAFSHNNLQLCDVVMVPLVIGW